MLKGILGLGIIIGFGIGVIVSYGIRCLEKRYKSTTNVFKCRYKQDYKSSAKSIAKVVLLIP